MTKSRKPKTFLVEYTLNARSCEAYVIADFFKWNDNEVYFLTRSEEPVPQGETRPDHNIVAMFPRVHVGCVIETSALSNEEESDEE